jgi:hypothetical protein
MQKDEFRDLLMKATIWSKEFAERFVKNKLPDDNIYRIQLNMSSDDPTLTQFDRYPEDEGKIVEDADLDQVVTTLCRNAKVPVWIDINVRLIKKQKTVFTLLCAGRYSDDPKELYYNSSGQGPFGIKSPVLPVGYSDGVKFNITEVRSWNWRRLLPWNRR